MTDVDVTGSRMVWHGDAGLCRLTAKGRRLDPIPLPPYPTELTDRDRDVFGLETLDGKHKQLIHEALMDLLEDPTW